MTKRLETGRKGDHRLPPQPVLLTPAETQQITGGLNPQPLPPCIDHRIGSA
jgi:hypothetical protein